MPWSPARWRRLGRRAASHRGCGRRSVTAECFFHRLSLPEPGTPGRVLLTALYRRQTGRLSWDLLTEAPPGSLSRRSFQPRIPNQRCLLPAPRNGVVDGRVLGTGSNSQEMTMLIKRALLIAAAVTLLSAPAMAAGDSSSSSPGQMMHKYGSHGQPGASYWAHHKRLHGQASGSELKTTTTTVHGTTGSTHHRVQSGNTSTTTTTHRSQ